MKLAFRALIILLTMFTSVITWAAAPAWQVVPNESSITFTATQNNAPVTGKFNSFTGDINFDSTQLNSSQVKIIVDTGSVATDYAQIADTLKTAEWFDVKNFPQAIFKSTNFIKTGDKTFQANGNLTIRDKTIPVTLTFTLNDYSADKFHLQGSTVLKRTAFGVGQGDWSKTDAVKDEVQVNFVLSAIKKQN